MTDNQDLAPEQEDTNLQDGRDFEDEAVNEDQLGKRQVQLRTGDRIRWEKKLDELFKVRQPVLGHTNMARHIRAVRELGREFAGQVVGNTPHCADQSASLRCIRQAVLWAEEAILHEGIS